MNSPITLPPDLQAKAEQEAEELGLSLPDFVCRSIEWVITHKPSDDPLFSDTAIYCDEGPHDLSKNHDDYLYGDAS